LETIDKIIAGRRVVPTAASACLLSLIMLSQAALAQQGLVMNLTASGQPVENSAVTIKAEAKSLANISQALLFYRNDLSTDFQQTEMSFDETSMTLNGTIPAAYVLSPYVEVYVRLIMRDGTSQTYPSESPTENPVRISVSSAESGQDILIISPERDQRLSEDNLMIAASLLYAPASVDRKRPGSISTAST